MNSYLENWNHDPKPFARTATPDKIITKVKLLPRDFESSWRTTPGKELSITRH
jgi:hypothetical protein